MGRCECYYTPDELADEAGHRAGTRCISAATTYLEPEPGYRGDEFSACDRHAARVLSDGGYTTQPYEVAS